MKKILMNQRLFKKTQVAIYTCMIVLIMSSFGWAANYYVDTARGNDANSGTLALPWKTIAKANSTLKAGDTVYIRAGTYAGEQIRPNSSGTASAKITYRNYNDEAVTISGSDTPMDLSSRNYVIITGSAGQDIIITNCDKYLTMTGGNYNEFAYLTIGPMRTYERFRGFQIGKDSSYNWVHHCTLFKYGYFSGTNDYGDMLYIGDTLSGSCSHNLIENNNLYHSGHNSITLNSKYNVVRNNYIHNEAWQSGFGGRMCELRHSTDGNPGDGGWNLIEGNRWGFSAQPPDGSTARAIKIISPDNIIRKNMFYRLEGPGIALVTSSANSAPYADNNYIYNNVFFYNGINGASESEGLIFLARLGAITGCVITNNIFNQNVGADVAYAGTGSLTSNTLTNNWGKANGNPLFVDAVPSKTTDPFNQNYPDFKLQSSSPCVNSGAFLTKTRSSGSGATIPVGDAHYFMNGWGIIEGDVIQLANQTQTAKIVNVDYINDTLTVDKSLTWSANQGVSLSYSGSGPDTGVHEYSVNQPPVNHNPIAVLDNASTQLNSLIAIDVLANDSDPDGNPVTLTQATVPAHGTASITGGKINYQPNQNYFGTDTFSYTISDGNGGSAGANVTVQIVNDPLKPPTNLHLTQ
jgi:hypothetical protein